MRRALAGVAALVIALTTLAACRDDGTGTVLYPVVIPGAHPVTVYRPAPRQYRPAPVYRAPAPRVRIGK